MFSFFFPPPQMERLMGLLHFRIRGVLHRIPPSYAHFGHFPTKGVGKSDDDHGSVCAVSGVLTPPGEEERKRTI